ncbi:putative toxin-antitoxin system toxin component, PIN family [Variovorax sp. MHTC-1]|uniref:putative toxin-antitoxin system toxin component, PIN family n=1 Tax=Variovorax sp. MHTC-1 TaxID=2495593 RepID=UPI000F860FB8|nr:putative toxin-antitoxin system toxin component, PIN family [Variovorax sp. MHTC-1]RST55286.1 putative toxin-antitoxin system toxin component, PIN family [Variovorax sp. MHTC-1]
MAARRVVFDTNVVLSALLFGGPATRRLRELWQQGACTPLISTATAGELVRVLGYPKFRLSPQEREELLADYLPFAQVVTLPDPPPAVPVCRDPFDLPFLQLAAAGKAMLVTGDRDLLVLSGATKFPILAIEPFIEGFGAL